MKSKIWCIYFYQALQLIDVVRTGAPNGYGPDGITHHAHKLTARRWALVDNVTLTYRTEIRMGRDLGDISITIKENL